MPYSVFVKPLNCVEHLFNGFWFFVGFFFVTRGCIYLQIRPSTRQMLCVSPIHQDHGLVSQKTIKIKLLPFKHCCMYNTFDSSEKHLIKPQRYKKSTKLRSLDISARSSICEQSITQCLSTPLELLFLNRHLIYIYSLSCTYTLTLLPLFISTCTPLINFNLALIKKYNLPDPLIKNFNLPDPLIKKSNLRVPY